jgi:hypothetical protein
VGTCQQRHQAIKASFHTPLNALRTKSRPGPSVQEFPLQVSTVFVLGLCINAWQDKLKSNCNFDSSNQNGITLQVTGDCKALTHTFEENFFASQEPVIDFGSSDCRPYPRTQNRHGTCQVCSASLVHGRTKVASINRSSQSLQ